MLLAAASLGFLDPYHVAGPFNALVFGLTIYVAGQGLRRHVQRPPLVVGACLAIMLALPLTGVASIAIAEAPFILFVTLSLVKTSKFLNTAKRSDLIWAAAFASLAILTRYMGVTLLIAVAPLLLLQRGPAPLEKVRRVGLYLLIATAPVGLWLAQMFLVHGVIHGHRVPSPFGLLEILDKYFSHLAGWVFLNPPSEDAWTAGAVFAAVALLTLAAAVGFSFLRARRKGEGADGWSPFYLFGGFALAYLIFLTAAQWRTEIMPLGGRYLSPMYIPLLFAAVLALDRFLSYARGRPWPASVVELPIIRTVAREGIEPYNLLVLVIVLASSLWLANGAALNAREIVRANEQGIGIEGPVWAGSEVLQYVRETPVDVPVLSGSSVVYIFAGRDDDYLSTHVTGAKRKLEEAAEGALVVWLYSFRWKFDYSIWDLPGLEPVAELSDGVIFKVNRAFDRDASWEAAYEALVSGQPAARSVFDLYLRENTLSYVKQPCSPADTEALFFLHLIPADVNDLADHRRQYGYDNLDFDYDDRRSVMFDGRCMITMALPEYDVIRVRTGQYVPGEDRLWEVEFPYTE